MTANEITGRATKNKGANHFKELLSPSICQWEMVSANGVGVVLKCVILADGKYLYAWSARSSNTYDEVNGFEFSLADAKRCAVLALEVMK